MAGSRSARFILRARPTAARPARDRWPTPRFAAYTRCRVVDFPVIGLEAFQFLGSIMADLPWRNFGPS